MCRYIRPLLASAVTAAALAALASPAMAINVVTDPSFETNPLAPDLNTILANFPGFVGQWGAEAGIITGPTNGITPSHLNHMLELSPFNVGSVSQAGQMIDVSSYAASIDAGMMGMAAGADYTSTSTAPIASIFVNYFTAANYGSLFGPTHSAGLNLDGTPTTWEFIGVSGIVPAGTRWILLQVAFDANSINNNAGLPPGGYVDNTYLDLRVIPEPAAVGLLAPALLLLARRRRAC